MTRLNMAAVALAAGLTAFAAHAEPPTATPVPPPARDAIAEPANVGKGFGKYLLTEDDGTPRGTEDKSKGKAAAGEETTRKPELVLKPRKQGKRAAGAFEAKSTTATSTGYGSIVARYSAAYGVPAALANAVIHVESGGRPGARGSAGEVGLMQIKPMTARGLGYSGSAKGLFDPDTNIRYGMLYLAKAHSLSGGDTCGTILRYNAGHGAKRMNPVSAAYCSKVKRQLER